MLALRVFSFHGVCHLTFNIGTVSGAYSLFNTQPLRDGHLGQIRTILSFHENFYSAKRLNERKINSVL